MAGGFIPITGIRFLYWFREQDYRFKVTDLKVRRRRGWRLNATVGNIRDISK